jgi:DNA invertase Pin-like site-specific DNA recombinase
MAWFADEERRMISARTKAALVGRRTASQIASASAASFLLRLT